MKNYRFNFLVLVLIVFMQLFCMRASAQQDRFKFIEEQLNEVAKTNPGLNEKVDFSVSGATIQEFLRGLAETNDLNISVDPQLNFRIFNNFTNEKVSNILLFLVKEYNLDIRFFGSIMSFYPYVQPAIPKVIAQPKEIEINYNSYSNTLTLDLKDDSLGAVTKRITQISKKNVILAPGLANRKVSVYAEEILFDTALEQFAFSNDLKVQKVSENIYLLKDKSAVDEIQSQPGMKTSKKGTAIKTTGTPAQYIEVKDSLGQKLISVEAYDVSIADIIKSVASEAGISYFLFSDIKGTTNAKLNNVVFDDFLTYLLQGTEYTYKSNKGLYLIGDRKLEGLRANKVIQFQYRSYDAIDDIIPAELRKGVEIKEFKELNSILLTGSLPQIEEIESFIKQLDRVVPMVMIEVILLDVRKNRTVKTGIQTGISDSIKGGGTILPGLDFNISSKSINDFLSYLDRRGPINLGRVTPSFYVGLSALEQNSNAEVRSMPKLSTLNGHDANLTIGSTRYYSTTTQNVLGSLNPQTVVTQQFTPVQANLAITIKPIVAGDDQVTLNIDVSISDFIGEPPQNSPPPSSNSQFKSMIRVKNEEMVVLGGIERMENSDAGSGTPILARIPVIKWFFSNRSKSKNKLVSVVFIKPTIIY